MNKKIRISALLFALMLALAGCGAIETRSYSFAAGPDGSDFYAISEGICTALTSGMSGVLFNPVESGGSADNANLIKNGEAEIALMTADQAAAAYSANADLRAITPLFEQTLHIVATGSSGIRSLSDLKARRVSLGTEGCGTAALSEKVLSAAGLALKDIQRQYLEPGEAFEEMKNGRLDACFVLAAPGSKTIADLAESMDLVLVPLDDAAVSALTADGALFSASVPAETYKNQSDAVNTVGVNVLVVCSASLPNDTVKTMAAILGEKAAETLAGFGISANTDASALTIPVHEGLEADD